MVLHGIVIADPAKTNMKFNNHVEHFEIERKLPAKPLAPYESEQERLSSYHNLSATVKGTQITVPVTNAIDNAELLLWRTRRLNLWAVVEKPQLEASKNSADTINPNTAGSYDPKSVNPASFKRTDLPKMKFVADPTHRIADPDKLANKFNYLYNTSNRNYQSCYYVDNPWKDSITGRVHLFEKPWVRIREIV